MDAAHCIHISGRKEHGCCIRPTVKCFGCNAYPYGLLGAVYKRERAFFPLGAQDSKYILRKCGKAACAFCERL